MEIIKTRVMRGPNYWSIHRHRLIVLTIQLTAEEKALGAADLDELGKKLEKLKPSLYHRKAYASILDVVAQVAIEIQCLAGMDCAHAAVQSTTQPLEVKVIFSYTIERAGIYAGRMAVELINALTLEQPYSLATVIQHLKKMHDRDRVSPDVQVIIDDAIKRGIPVTQLDRDTLLFGFGANQHLFRRGVDHHFPTDPLPGRIPLVAVTGTNGKTTTTRLIAHFASYANYQVGMTTTDGIYIQNKLVDVGDCSGPQSARTVLKNPEIDFAVLECARGGILRAGLGFDCCNVSVVTNISRDHLGMDDIESLADLARVKAVVPRTTLAAGCAVLNADDDLVYQMKDNLRCQVALFSMNAKLPRFLDHVQSGQLGATVENGNFVLFNKRSKITVINIKQVPLTFEGKSACMIQNVLPALLTAFFLNMPLEDIRIALKKFIPSPRFTPGRMNTFKVNDLTVMVDYAHNEAGYQELKKYADQLDFLFRVGIIAAVEDRVDADLVNLGRLAAWIFDEIIIRHDSDMDEQTKDRMTALLLEGIRQADENLPVQVISNEFDAIKQAMAQAKKGSWIFVNSEHVYDTIAFLTDYSKTAVQRDAAPYLQRGSVF
ncbi:UDP-N-acetylmuramyl tripeptide synthase [Pedobacter sp. CAN_A7]|uniref:Mur ligase family protein n=1 Tax=Pedobacter sp. CAN_A7 TaxID=2787722 RepID=UPI0018C8FF90